MDNKKKKHKLLKSERIQMFMSKCFIICPRCLTILPFGTETCPTCMEILNPKERIFQKNLHIHKNTKNNFVKVEP